jgi:GMP synthase (glutamine-hydrolysing)
MAAVTATVSALVLQHESDAPAGLLEGWARARGLDLHVVRPDRGAELPDPRDWHFAVILGAVPSVFDETVGWIADELDWIARADAAAVPLLGVCFGAQALAVALGGQVRRAAAPELGWVTVATAHPSIAAGPWFTWHQDEIELPTAARELAHNAAGVQVFEAGNHLGVQFHPEVTPEYAGIWVASAGSDHPGVALDLAQLRADIARLAPAAEVNAHALFDFFLARTRLAPAR